MGNIAHRLGDLFRYPAQAFGSMKRFRFRLIWLFVGVAVLAWVANEFGRYYVNRSRISRHATLVSETLKKLGGGGKRIGRVSGRTPYDRYTLNLHSVTDESITNLAELQSISLVGLNIEDRPITDRGTISISGCTTLEQLDLSGTDISDESIQSLTGLSRLQSLDLTDTDVTDNAVDSIMELRNLRVLYIGGAKLTDNGIKRLRGHCPWLTVYELNHATGWGGEPMPR